MRLAWRVDAQGIEVALREGGAVGEARAALQPPETPVSAEALLRWAAGELADTPPGEWRAWLDHLHADICGNPCAVGALDAAVRALAADLSLE